jgi:hypothetical protein
MTTAACVFENEWGMIIDRPADGYAEIRWFDTTADLSLEGFQDFLAAFASVVEKNPGRSALVDATAFKMKRENFSPEWRDANIIPRYNAARVRKFAFHMPQGMPLIGKEPAPEGPATFPTAYFGTRRDALAWLRV